MYNLDIDGLMAVLDPRSEDREFDISFHSKLSIYASLIYIKTNVIQTFWNWRGIFVDSSTVLAWIQRNEIWDVFVHNKIKEIKQLTSIETWRQVPVAMNPADLPSRGCSASYIIASRWWEGPECLYLSPEEWPKEDFSADEKEIALEKKKKIVSILMLVI
ncbi:hypothetical protein AVEN_221539-1 [Araneus ventricosus]|uniref:Uncharacterized protein n=1 Tax=Araneus ventricosus TaxID=182803 RepID=A0A4Y2TP45_ARAVE|nr:hypothetical protein AVEN_221539-1 [Araneus ventricosus]